MQSMFRFTARYTNVGRLGDVIPLSELKESQARSKTGSNAASDALFINRNIINMVRVMGEMNYEKLFKYTACLSAVFTGWCLFVGIT